MKKFITLLSASLCILLVGCNSDSKTLLPFQSERNGGWGLISADGKVVFEDEFDNRPGSVIDGRFFVKNGDGMWELYTAEEKPKQIGEEYLYVGEFCNGVAPVTEKDKPVSLINKEGKIVKTLDKLAGKTVTGITSFENGVACFLTDEELGGLINTKGDVLLKPTYTSLKIIGEHVFGVDKKDKDKEVFESNLHVFNLKGKEISTINLKNKNITDFLCFSEDKIAVRTGTGYKEKVGILDLKGEWVLKPTSKIRSIREIQGDYLIDTKDGKWGLKKLDGEVVLRPKYDYLTFCEGVKDLLIAYDDYEAMLINFKGEQVGKETYESLKQITNSQNFAAEVSDHEYVFLNKKGKEISASKEVDIYSLGSRDYDDFIESDYVDMASIVDALQITKSSIDGLSLTDKVSKVVSRAGEKNDRIYTPDEFRFLTWVSYKTKAGLSEPRITVGFDEIPTSPLTHWVDFGYGYGYDEIDGYEYKSISPQGISVGFDNEGKLQGKGKALYEELCKKAKSLGTVYKSRGYRLVVKIDDTHSAYVYYSGVDDEDAAAEEREYVYEENYYDWIYAGNVTFAIANLSPSALAQGVGLEEYINEEEITPLDELN